MGFSTRGIAPHKIAAEIGTVVSCSPNLTHLLDSRGSIRSIHPLVLGRAKCPIATLISDNNTVFIQTNDYPISYFLEIEMSSNFSNKYWSN